MKGKKCFGLLLLLSIMVGLSLNASLDVSAKQYSIDSFLAHPVLIPIGPDSGSSVPIHIDVTSTDGLTPRALSYITSSYNSSTQKCDYGDYINRGYTMGSTSIDYFGSFYSPYYFGSNNCSSMLPFGYSSSDVVIPEFNTDSIPFNKRLNVDSMLPYHYMFNTMPINGTRTIDGVEYSSKFDISELLNNLHTDSSDPDIVYYTDIIKSFTLPLNFDASLESLTSGTSVQFAGRLNLGSDFTQSEAEAFSISFEINYYDGSGSSGVRSSCSTSYYNSSLSFLCSLTIPRNIDSSLYSFTFTLTTSNSSLSSSKTSLTFDSFFITLNDEPDIWGGNGSFEGNGSFPNVAPGVPDVDVDNADWFSSLTNLFGFSLINPFAPLFNMFTDQSQCASIPIIASMIGSNETTYCPWFSSTTRNVLTPVLSIASIMLIFGFVVRWLSSSSGNMFEDQTTHKWGNTQLKQGGK